jgi:hypothetical protein
MSRRHNKFNQRGGNSLGTVGTLMTPTKGYTSISPSLDGGRLRKREYAKHHKDKTLLDKNKKLYDDLDSKPSLFNRLLKFLGFIQ